MQFRYTRLSLTVSSFTFRCYCQCTEQYSTHVSFCIISSGTQNRTKRNNVSRKRDALEVYDVRRFVTAKSMHVNWKL